MSASGTPMGRRRNRGQLLAATVLAPVLLGGATASVWLKVADARLRRRLAEIQDHPRRHDLAGRVRCRMYGPSGPREMTLELVHHAPDRTRLTLAETHRPDRPAEGRPSRFGRRGRMGGRVSGRMRGIQLAQLWQSRWQIPLLLRNYRVREVAGPTTLGRPTRQLTVHPLRPHRPGLTLLVDDASGVPLESRLWGPAGQPLMEFAFLTLRFDPPRLPDAETTPARAPWPEGTPFTVADARALSDGPWLPARLPGGFELQTISRIDASHWRGRGRGQGRPGPRGEGRPGPRAERERPEARVRARGPLWRLTYHDGLARLLIMQRDGSSFWSRSRSRRSRGRHGERTSREFTVEGHTGRLHESPGRLMAWIKMGQRTLSIIGPIAEAELRDCVSSITPQSDSK